MTITTSMAEQLAIARRYECEQRFAQASEAYGMALAAMPHATSLEHADDRAMIEGMRMACIHRSHEMVSNTLTTATEEAKAAMDEQGRRAYMKWHPEG